MSLVPAGLAAAPARPPRPTSPVPHPAARPDLRPDLEVVGARRRHRIGATTGAVVVVVGVFVVLFGLAAFHTLLVQGQQRLDDIDRRVTEAQDRYERRRLEVAQLEAPGRIVDTAVNELGMVPPAATTYLMPSGALEAEVAAARVPPEQGAPATEQAAGPVGSWMTVKSLFDDPR